MLPFSTEQFLDVFASYNAAVWPAPVVAYILGAIALGLTLRPAAVSGRVISAVLALMWAWTGVAYHWMHFAGINPAAWAFGAAFVAQGLLILSHGVLRPRLEFGLRPGAEGAFGMALVGYAMALYPLVGYLAGHRYPLAPTFGITPCPVTLFTVGMLLLAHRRVHPALAVIPGLWSLIGGSAAFLLGLPQDWALLFGGGAGSAILLARAMRAREDSGHVRSVQARADRPAAPGQVDRGSPVDQRRQPPDRACSGR